VALWLAASRPFAVLIRRGGDPVLDPRTGLDPAPKCPRPAFAVLVMAPAVMLALI
jgi:hypothetical protein